MTKNELIEKVAADAKITKVAAAAAVNSALKNIVAAVAEGDTVALPGFGTFATKVVPAKEGAFNGVAYKTEAHSVPSFKAGKNFKEAL